MDMDVFSKSDPSEWRDEGLIIRHYLRAYATAFVGKVLLILQAASVRENSSRFFCTYRLLYLLFSPVVVVYVKEFASNEYREVKKIFDDNPFTYPPLTPFPYIFPLGVGARGSNDLKD